MIQRRKVILGTLGVAAGLAASGCSSPDHTKDGTGAAAPSAAPARLTVTPVSGADRVSPAEPVVVTVDGGRLRSVTVAAGTKRVGGTVQPDGVTWRSTGTLAYGKTYKVTASVVDGTGATVQRTSTFTTLKPRAVTGISFQANGMALLKTGGTYGVGQPVAVAFHRAVTDRAAAEKAITVTTTPAVQGKFFWVSSKIVHWRPVRYWAKGTKVEVSVDTLGVDLGKGVYGTSKAKTHFTVGRALLAVCDTRSHQTKVYIDGKLVRTMACSTGRGGYTTTSDGDQIHFWTQNGPHVVLSKEPTHSMSSASYGVSDPKNPYYYAPEDVRLCTRISYSGEFLHAAPWNHKLGRANISHGCVNLSVADAQWVYDNFLVGDVVDVRNSPKELPIWDGLGDWTVPYARYGT